MTMTATYKRKGIKGIIFAAMLAFAALTSFGAEAASSCTVKYSGGNVTPECPDGRKARYDISPKCIEDANKAAGNCLNTMPVTNVARTSATAERAGAANATTTAWTMPQEWAPR